MKITPAPRRWLILIGALTIAAIAVALAFDRDNGERAVSEDLLSGARNVDRVCALLHQVSVQQNMTSSVNSPAVLTSYTAFLEATSASGASRFEATAQRAMNELRALSEIAADSPLDPEGLMDRDRLVLRIRIDLATMSLACVLQGQRPGAALQTSATATTKPN